MQPADPANATNPRVWRVFYTRSRAEKRAEALLEEQDLEVFLPKRAEVRQWKDRKKRVVLPLFPGYLFACVDERERLQVLQTDGVVRTVSMDGRPCAMTQEEIDQLKLIQQAPEQLEATPISLPELGARVTVRRGLMSGLTGDVWAHRSGTHVVLLLPSIKQAVKIRVPGEWVEEVEIQA